MRQVYIATCKYVAAQDGVLGEVDVHDAAELVLSPELVVYHDHNNS